MSLGENRRLDGEQVVERDRCVDLPHKRLSSTGQVSSGASAAAISAAESP
jgi:hypothetical protein